LIPGEKRRRGRRRGKEERIRFMTKMLKEEKK